MIARRALADAPRPRQIARQHAADGLAALDAAQERAPIAGLEGEHLPVRRERRLDLGERRRRARGQHQLLGLVETDAGEGRQVDDVGKLQRPAEAALAAAGDQLERLVARQRAGDDLDQLALVGGAEDGSRRALKNAAGREKAAAP